MSVRAHAAAAPPEFLVSGARSWDVLLVLALVALWYVDEADLGPNLTAVAPIVVGVPAQPAGPIERRPADVIAWK